MYIRRSRYRRLTAERLNETCSALIGKMDLNDLQVTYLNDRWIANLVGMNTRQQQNKDRYYIFRSISLVSSVIAPALVSLNLLSRWAGGAVDHSCPQHDGWPGRRVLELLHPGERWRINRSFYPVLYRYDTAALVVDL